MKEEKESAKDGDEDAPPEETVAAVKEALDELTTQVSMYGGTTCDQKTILAMSDERVQEHFAARIVEGQLFTGVYCPHWPSIPEEAPVLFEFRVLPPAVSLIPSYFLVMLNVITGEVARIIDPYTAVAARPVHGSLTAGS